MMLPKLKLILTTLTRLVGVAYIVIAGFSIPESLKLLEESYTKEGDTLYVPLLVCEPTEIEVEGTTVAFNSTETNQIGQCHNLEYLVQVVILSLAFGMFATFVFFIFDMLASRKIGPYRKSTVLGMGLFLIFILVQSTLISFSLARELIYYTEYFSRIYEESGYDEAYGVTSVATYGNSTLLFATGGVAALASLLLLVEAIVKACWKDEDDDLVNGVPRSTKSSASKRASASTITAPKDLELQDNTESTTMDPPTVDLAPLSSSVRLDDSGYPNPDQPSWLSGN